MRPAVNIIESTTINKLLRKNKDGLWLLTDYAQDAISGKTKFATEIHEAWWAATEVLNEKKQNGI